MKTLKANYEILTPIDGVKELQAIERAARTCYKSEDKITKDGESARKMVRSLVKSGHLAMIEHAPSLSVKFTIDRGVSHEAVRHRLSSFAQESTRYVNYSKDKFDNTCKFIDIMNGMSLDTKMQHLSAEEQIKVYLEWASACNDAEKHYFKMLELGATPQIARSVLPSSTATELVITANHREWRNILKLRTDISAHPQIREVMIPLLIELTQKLPELYDDINYSSIKGERI